MATVTCGTCGTSREVRRCDLDHGHAPDLRQCAGPGCDVLLCPECFHRGKATDCPVCRQGPFCSAHFKDDPDVGVLCVCCQERVQWTPEELAAMDANEAAAVRAQAAQMARPMPGKDLQ